VDAWTSELRAKGLLSEPAASRLSELETRAHVPLAREIHALLFLGAAFILAGVGAAVKDGHIEFGPASILASLGFFAAVCFAYGGRIAPPFALERVPAPTAAFDYALYLGCGLVGIFFSYLEYKFKMLGDWWDMYLFFSGLVALGLAYRFDNRLVLSTGLVNLAGWIGVRFNRWSVAELGVRAAAFALGAALIALGETSRRSKVKEHFEETYLQFGVNLALMALLYGAKGFMSADIWLLWAACAALGFWSIRLRRFSTFATVVVYAYAGFLRAALPAVHKFTLILWVFMLSSGVVLAALLGARRRFREAS
jgi:hypothetical protein